MSREAFSRGNKLWFGEGRTAKALAAYADALRAEPTDPVVLFQLARALWSVDRFDEARQLLERAHRNRAELSDIGRLVLDHWRERLSAPPPERHFPELPPALLDRDRLEAGFLPATNWLTVADAANEREMFGLAAYAFDRWGGVPLDAEEAREMDRTDANRANDEAMLAQMRAGAAGAAGSNVPRAPDEGRRPPSAPPPAPGGAPGPRPSGPSPPEASRPPLPGLPDLPLELEVRATPTAASVGTDTTLTARLLNRTAEPQVVNRRMLLNHVGGPGEVWLDVDGPEGYRNTAGFRVNAGRAPAEFFVTLEPNGAVEQSWRLEDYQSLHVPGSYDLTLVYHNDDDRAPDGRPMGVGKVAGSTRIRRH